MTLQELFYVNMKRTEEAANRSLPPPPYNFRPRTIAQRQPGTNLSTLTLTVPGREDWVFTGALAKPSLAAKINHYLAGCLDQADEYESEEESVQDEDGNLRKTRKNGSSKDKHGTYDRSRDGDRGRRRDKARINKIN